MNNRRRDNSFDAISRAYAEALRRYVAREARKVENACLTPTLRLCRDACRAPMN